MTGTAKAIPEQKLREIAQVLLFVALVRIAFGLVDQGFDDICSNHREMCERIEKTCEDLRHGGDAE